MQSYVTGAQSWPNYKGSKGGKLQVCLIWHCSIPFSKRWCCLENPLLNENALDLIIRVFAKGEYNPIGSMAKDGIMPSFEDSKRHDTSTVGLLLDIFLHSSLTPDSSVGHSPPLITTQQLSWVG